MVKDIPAMRGRDRVKKLTIKNAGSHMYQKPKTLHRTKGEKKASVSWIIRQCYTTKIYPSALWVTLVWSVPYIILHTLKKIPPKHPSCDVQSNTSSCAGKIQKEDSSSLQKKMSHLPCFGL